MGDLYIRPRTLFSLVGCLLLPLPTASRSLAGGDAAAGQDHPSGCRQRPAKSRFQSAGLIPGPRLVWDDTLRTLPVGFDRMACEVESLFRDVGVEVRLRRGPAEEASADQNAVHVIPMSRPRPVWRLREDVLAAAPREEGVPQRIYVFLSRVQRVLGHGGKADASSLLRHNLEFSRALGRVLAHEIVHAVAPAHPHADTGLMSARQRRDSLLRRRARFDPDCVKSLLQALASS